MAFGGGGELGVGRRIGIAAPVGMFFGPVVCGKLDDGGSVCGSNVEGSIADAADDTVRVVGAIAAGMAVVDVVVVVVVAVVLMLMLMLDMSAGEAVVVVGLTVTMGTTPLQRVAVVAGGVSATTGRTWLTRPEHKGVKKINN